MLCCSFSTTIYCLCFSSKPPQNLCKGQEKQERKEQRGRRKPDVERSIPN